MRKYLILLALLLPPSVCHAGMAAKRMMAVMAPTEPAYTDAFPSLTGWTTNGWGADSTGRSGEDGSAYIIGDGSSHTLSKTVTRTFAGKARIWSKIDSGGTGTFQWRVNGGAWSTISATGGATSWQQSAPITTVPGDNLIEIQLTAGTAVLHVDDLAVTVY